jgi:hypothetical protein
MACSPSQASASAHVSNLVLHDEPIEVITEPHIEAGIVEAGDLEIDFAVVEPLENAHGVRLLEPVKTFC